MLFTSSLIGLAAPLTCFIVHILAYRLFQSTHSMQRQKLTLLVIAIATLLSLAIAGVLTQDPDEALHAGVVSLLFGYTYFHWFNMSETARRIRMLVRYVALGHAPEAGEAYTANVILVNRLQRLVETGTIAVENGKYVVRKGPLLWATRVILFWRSLFYAN
jgi:hypothetical protein